MAEGGEPEVSVATPGDRTSGHVVEPGRVRGTLREILMEILGFQQLAEGGFPRRYWKGNGRTGESATRETAGPSPR